MWGIYELSQSQSGAGKCVGKYHFISLPATSLVMTHVVKGNHRHNKDGETETNLSKHCDWCK
jgi:hypothetical protein